MNLRQLEAFLAVIETASFSKGAKRLGLGQSTVSTHVAALERSLGLTLFDRSRGRIRPTRAGTALVAHAREILSARRRAESTLQSYRDAQTGELLLAASTIPATYLVPAWIRGFRKRHPLAVVKVRTGDSREALAALLETQADLALVGSRPEPAARFRATQVAEDRLVLAVPPRHPLASRRSVRPADLKGLPFLQRELGSGTRESVERALRRAGLDPEHDLPLACEMGSTEAVREGVIAGLGAALLSAWAVAEAARSGSLKVVALEGFEDRRAIWLASLAGASLTPLAKSFLKEVQGGG